MIRDAVPSDKQIFLSMGKEFYSITRGDEFHKPIGGVSRKLCNIIFTILRENRPYEPVPPKKRLEE